MLSKVTILSKQVTGTLIAIIFLFISNAFTVSEKDEVGSAIERGRDFLKSVQRGSGAICDSVAPLFDIRETVFAASALYETKKDTNELVFKKAMTYLRRNENASGFLCSGKKCRKEYCIETTSAYFQLLIKMGLKEKAMPRIIAIKNLQKKTGEWEIGNNEFEQKDFPSITANAMVLLNKCDVGLLNEKTGLIWLMAKQNKQGNWGSSAEYYDCNAYALLPAMNISTTNRDYVLAKEKAATYILNSQNKNGSWRTNDSIKNVSAEFQTAFMLQAIKNFNNKGVAEAITAGVKFLIDSQNSSGAWDGGTMPLRTNKFVKREYIMATSMALMALQHRLTILSSKK